MSLASASSFPRRGIRGSILDEPDATCQEAAIRSHSNLQQADAARRPPMPTRRCDGVMPKVAEDTGGVFTLDTEARLRKAFRRALDRPRSTPSLSCKTVGEVLGSNKATVRFANGHDFVSTIACED